MDDRIQQYIGLSDGDTTDLLQKYYLFVHSLNAQQQEVIRACMPSFDQAATAIGAGTSASDIQQFVSSRLNSSPAQGIPVPTGQSGTAIPVPTAQSAVGIPVPTNKS
jgi:hypothetical protein